MCLCGTDVQYSYFVSPDRYQYCLQLSTDSKFCMQLGTPISMPTTRTPFIGRLYFIYQSIGQIIFFQMKPPLRSFDDLDGKERGQKKTDNLRAMTTLGPRTLQLLMTRPTCGFIHCWYLKMTQKLQRKNHVSSLQIFFCITFIKITFQDNISVSKSLDPDQP